MTFIEVGGADAQLAEALAAHQAGLLDQAEGLYRRILTEQPDQVNALHLLGVVALQQGRLDEAGTLLQRVLTLAPDAADAWGHLVSLHQLRGDAASEAAGLDRLLALRPHQAQLWGRRGVLAFMAEELELACTHFARAAELDPTSADAWTNLGAAQLRLGRLAEAETSQRRAVAADPSSLAALNNLGNALVARSRWAEAAPLLERVVQHAPTDANGWVNLGHALRGMRRYPDALVAYERALELRPDDPIALDGIGFTLFEQGDDRRAISYHERALALLPDNADINEHLGVALLSAGRLGEAAARLRRCLEIDPERSGAHSNLIFVLDLTQGGEAATQEERRRWNAQFGRGAAEGRPPHRNSPDPTRRLRVGYVSGDFRHHSAANAILPILRNHDHGEVEIVCYSTVITPDQVTAEIRALADRWHDVATVSDDDLDALIRADQIDILIDLSGHSGGNRLMVFARQPAPIQVTAWGYIASTGLEAMQYLLGDPVVTPPEDRASYIEEIVDLPSVICYEPPPAAPAIAPLPARERGYVTFGAFNRLPKISAGSVEAWARVLAAVPSSRLIIKFSGADLPQNREHLLGSLAAHGVQPERVTLLGGTPQPEHLAAHAEIDLMLDTFPQSGGVTTLDALLMGVPVVSLLGKRVTGRISASFLTSLGLADLVARTPDEYVEIAARLAGDLDRLAHERATLRDRMLASPVANAAQYTRAVEAAYRELWQRWCAGRKARGDLRLPNVRALRHAVVRRPARPAGAAR
jgi:protein O-GlcNAc transferase